ncbi:hypothetical protein SG18_25315 [Pandoraea apista]|nr:hypothetical protein SG18_25315 [Pandoraea apista]AKH71807.1 hypothetical protein XM39_05870 [Pandoraea apista]AKI64082.1 hypothetical protein AA956_23190 [Pandoraea apista]
MAVGVSISGTGGRWGEANDAEAADVTAGGDASSTGAVSRAETWGDAGADAVAADSAESSGSDEGGASLARFATSGVPTPFGATVRSGDVASAGVEWAALAASWSGASFASPGGSQR